MGAALRFDLLCAGRKPALRDLIRPQGRQGFDGYTWCNVLRQETNLHQKSDSLSWWQRNHGVTLQ